MSHIWSIITRPGDERGVDQDSARDVSEVLELAERMSNLAPQRNAVAALRPDRRGDIGILAGPSDAGTVIAEPADRGSAVSVIVAALHVLDTDPEATLVLMPLGRSMASEERLFRVLPTAIEEAERSRGSMIVLATTPSSLECRGVWIVPNHDGELRRSAPAARLASDPDPASAQRFVRRGALISTDVMVVSGRTLLGMLALALPRALGEFVCWRQAHEGTLTHLRHLYAKLPRRDLYADFLERCSDALRVMPVPTDRCCRTHQPVRALPAWEDTPGA
jgi:mannose-1-phosphate guanylyltransferase